ncbi:MAG: hypothetical protein OXI60_05805 [Acidiferrobacterales bacterium]|nr:hypothetical protein [Acidiferrobacterales bacterium]
MDKTAHELRRQLRRTFLPLVAGVVMFTLKLSGQFGAGSGYGLLLVSVCLITAGVVATALLVFTRRFSTESLTGALRWLLWAGGWLYVIAVFDLSGYYVAEGLAGNVELRWMLFGPLALATLALFDIGLYRILVQKNRPSWVRYRQHISREHAEPEAARKTFVMDVVLHTSLLSVSGFRWLRHTLIYWGFVLLFGVEIIAVFVREGIPAFGMIDIWEIPGHPVRLAFDFAFEFFGFMVLAGCLMSFMWRVKAGGTQEQKFADTPSVLFLFLVVFSGFVVEAARFATDGAPDGSGYSFVGFALMLIMGENVNLLVGIYTPIWYFHVFGSLAFIVYVPAFRLIHSCATPIGRIITSQKRILSSKRMHSIRGLAMRTGGKLNSEVEMD